MRSDQVDYPGAPVTVADALAAGRPLRMPRWGIVDFWIALAIAYGVSFLVAIPLFFAGASGPAIIITTLTTWLGFAGWPWWVTRRKGNGLRIDLGLRFSRSDIAWGVGASILAMPIAVGLSLATSAVVGDFDSTAGTMLDELGASSTGWMIVFALLVAIGSPIAEEICFRGLGYAAFRKRGLGAGWTIALTTVLFAVIHGEPARIVILLFLGAVYGLVRWRTGSLGAAITAHLVNNALVVMLSALGVG